jgi:hypothetical protein
LSAAVCVIASCSSRSTQRSILVFATGDGRALDGVSPGRPPPDPQALTDAAQINTTK